MGALTFGKYLSVFLASTVFFSKLGVPAALAAFDNEFIKAIITLFAGSTFSAVVFTYLSDGISNSRETLKDRWFSKPKHPKKVFTTFNRRVVKIKHRFRLIGIAALTPPLLSIPVGAFLAERFFKNKQKVILYIAISNLFWSITFYFLYFYFWQQIKSWLGL